MNKKYIITLAVISLGAVASFAGATHSWGGYHWARTANPFTVKLGDNLSAAWDPYLGTTSYDWTLSGVLDTTIVPGTVSPKTCKATSGQVQICNSKYGRNGWLGIASIWISGDHITQGTVKMNDTYFSTAQYNTPAWKNLVLCQEVGHAFGLDHQDENFNNAPLGTCIDYTSDPTPNQHPNAHDYEMLESIYAHLDTTTTVSQSSASSAQDIDHSNPKSWDKVLRASADKKSSVHELDLGKDQKVFTFVIWADSDHASHE